MANIPPSYGVYAKQLDGRSTSAREAVAILRNFFMWAFVKLANGENVYLYDLGIITAVYRGARKKVGFNRKDQLATFSLKIKTSPKLKRAMEKFAATHPDPENAFRGQGTQRREQQ